MLINKKGIGKNMKKIVVVASIDGVTWVFGVFNTRTSAYNNLVQFYPELLNNEYPDNVRGFSKAVKEGHAFSFTRIHGEDSEEVSTRYDFIIQEINQEEIHPKTYRGIDTFATI